MQTPQREEILRLLADLTASSFEAVAALVYEYQRSYNPLYAKYIELLGAHRIRPFMPISFFKTHDIRSGDWQPDTFFNSSGTTGQIPSTHQVRDLPLYLSMHGVGFRALMEILLNGVF
ncbi:MAG: hypothetical protein IPH31_22360 [Lewinellaceae bacterium]|nr:hypothetical protein [Lewinellaceae bacterium]